MYVKEMYKKLIYFVRREAERKKERKGERECVREKRPTGKTGGSYACVCVNLYNVRTHVCVASRARMRRERRIVVIAYFIMDESETDNQASGSGVGGSLRGHSVQACSQAGFISAFHVSS